MADLSSVANQAITNMPIATQMITTATAGNDITGTLQLIAAAVAAVLVMAWPLMRLVRMWNSDKTSNTKDSTESFLYKHLKDQIEDAKKDNQLAKEENLRLWAMIHDLEARLKKIEDFESSNEKLKIKLDFKDEKLKQKDDMIESLRTELEVSSKMISHLYAELRERDTQIKILQDDVNNLKARLSTDEQAILTIQQDGGKG